MNGMWTNEDKEQAEYAIETALEYMRYTPYNETSVFKRNQNRKTIKNEMSFLKDNFPESYILSQDISDVSLAPE